MEQFNETTSFRDSIIESAAKALIEMNVSGVTSDNLESQKLTSKQQDARNEWRRWLKTAHQAGINSSEIVGATKLLSFDEKNVG